MKFVLRIETLINFLVVLSSSYGDIRCHCNQPICVRTGYMCKSTGASAACFLEHSGYANVDGISDISRHGCIELLPPHIRHICVNNHLTHSHSNHHSNHHLIHRHGSNQSIVCCSEDMCNYVKNIDIINARTLTKTNDTQSGTYQSAPTHHQQQPAQASSQPGSSSSAAAPTTTNVSIGTKWFEITVITVAVLGSVLLVILILMATKVLRQDNKRQRQMNELRKQRQFKTDLLLNSNGSNANEILVKPDNRCMEKRSMKMVKEEKNYKNEKVASTKVASTKVANTKMNDIEKACDINTTSGNSNLYNIINLSYKHDTSTHQSQSQSDNRRNNNIKSLNNQLYNSLLSSPK